jgi:hypothetical protein
MDDMRCHWLGGGLRAQIVLIRSLAGQLPVSSTTIAWDSTKPVAEMPTEPTLNASRQPFLCLLHVSVAGMNEVSLVVVVKGGGEGTLSIPTPLHALPLYCCGIRSDQT